MRRLASKKSYSWWWDSHVSPMNSKWLAENLEEMDKLVKEMLKLIEEEGDSFAKKAEMYYQRRPELISHVEDFYRMYRALAERYDNVTGELRNSMPTKPRRSPGSGGGFDFISGSPSPSPEHTPNSKLPKLKSTPRAAGFDVFLGSGGSSDISRNASDSSSSSDSESYCVEVKEENGIDADEQCKRIINLENEILDLKQKLAEYEEGSLRSSPGHVEGEDLEELRSRALELERELYDATDRVHVAEEDIMRLMKELERKNQQPVSTENGDVSCSRLTELENELIAANERVHISEKEITRLKQDLEKGEQVNVALLSARKQIAELEEHVITLEEEIANCKHEIEELRTLHTATLEHCTADISARDEVIRELNLEIASVREEHLQDKHRAEADIADHNLVIEQLKTSIQIFSYEKSTLEGKVLEQEQMIEEVKASMTDTTKKFLEEKSRLEAEIAGLVESCTSLRSKIGLLEIEKRKIEAEKIELCATNMKNVNELNKNLIDLKDKLDILNSEKDELSARVCTLTEYVKARDDLISRKDVHLQQLHIEHVKLIKEADEARRVSKEMQIQVKELTSEVEQQRIAISDGAERKREAIRQLCFSLEHYRVGYQELRQALLGGHKRPKTLLVA